MNPNPRSPTAASLSGPLRITDGLWMLGNTYFNLYLVRGDRQSALVEVGISAIVDAVIAQLDEIGASPDYLVLSHPHTDHLTGLEGLMTRFPEARVVAAAGARAFASHPKAGPKIVAEDKIMSARLAMLGWHPERSPVEGITFPEAYLRIDAPTAIDLGGVTLRCLLTQGHSPGSLAVHIPEKSALLTSDALGFRYQNGDFCPLFFTDYRAYMETLDRLAALEATILGPAHQGVLTGREARNAFAASRRTAKTLYDRIVASSESGGEYDGSAAHAEPGGELVDALFAEYYRDAFTLYSEENIRGCMQLLVRRALETRSAPSPTGSSAKKGR